MPSVIDLSDGELSRQASEGDEKAFREILRRNRSRILAICLRMLRNRTESEEAAQDSFVKIYLHLNEFDPERNFSAWAAGIAINECRDRLRKRSRTKRIFQDLEDSEIDRLQQPREDAPALRAEVEAVEEAIEQLPPKLKEVLVLRAYGEYSYEEIGAILKIRTGTVMSRLHRSREKLTELMKRRNR